ncbi:MAG: nitroreductase [Clostridia bacterium]|nr:nitroreductase [Clostridia bacterium]
MNEVFQNMLTRVSVKKYKPDEVKREWIEKIVEAGIAAPSGRNWQAPIVLAITNKTWRDKLSQINAKIMGMSDGFDPFYGAPVVLVVLADKSRNTYLYDGSLVMENMLLATHSLGLGGCWIHRAKETFETEEGKALLKSIGLEGDYEGIGNCVIGYPDGELPNVKPRVKNRIYYID